ncbi:hypothetical protein LSAT2_019164, partial [Lamellibrachia satsuma]
METLQTFGESTELLLQHFAINPSSHITDEKRNVNPSPGPAEYKRNYMGKNPWHRCRKGVTARSRAISCDFCGQWTNNKCAGVFSSGEYNELCSSGDL